jgi:tetratricopeptide (TPR) repeat protein
MAKPDNSEALAGLAYLYSNSTDQAELLKSLDYFSQTLSTGYKLPGVYDQMGLVSWQLKDYPKAESFWQQALKLSRHDTSALYYLDQVRQLKLEGKLSD